MSVIIENMKTSVLCQGKPKMDIATNVRQTEPIHPIDMQ